MNVTSIAPLTLPSLALVERSLSEHLFLPSC
jgi:hypothetical protein